MRVPLPPGVPLREVHVEWLSGLFPLTQDTLLSHMLNYCLLFHDRHEGQGGWGGGFWSADYEPRGYSMMVLSSFRRVGVLLFPGSGMGSFTG